MKKANKTLILPYKQLPSSTVKIIIRKTKTQRLAIPDGGKISIDSALDGSKIIPWSVLENELQGELKILLYPSPTHIRAIEKEYKIVIPFTNKVDTSRFEAVVPHIKVYKSRTIEDELEFPVLILKREDTLKISIKDVKIPLEFLPVKPSLQLVQNNTPETETPKTSLDPMTRILATAEANLTPEEMALLMKILTTVRI